MKADGLITYMRTDSVALSKAAIEEAREVICELYGQDYAPATPRIFKNKAKTPRKPMRRSALQASSSLQTASKPPHC